MSSFRSGGKRPPTVKWTTYGVGKGGEILPSEEVRKAKPPIDVEKS